MDVFLARILVATGNDIDHRRYGLKETAGEVGGTVMGNFEDFRSQVERAAVVLAREKAAGFVIEITGK